MKKTSTLFFIASLSLFFIQCQTDEITITPIVDPLPTGDTINVDDHISSNVTWTSGKTYILNDLIAVTDGATLTIEPCVVVKAAKGATGLIISQGAKLDAQGTAACPIIFTSTDDQLNPGDIVSPNLTGDDTGLWSGIFILGNAPVSSMTSTNVISLLPQQPLYTFGGNAPDDNSGTLRYVSIRHTGFGTAPAEKPSGLNLGGVGTGTTINNVETFASIDDGVKIVGGTVNLDNIMVAAFEDDGIDSDQGWSGILDNLISIGSSAHNTALELEGGEGTDNPSFTIRNVSSKGSPGGNDYVLIRANAICNIENAYFFGFSANATVALRNDADADNWLGGLTNFSNLEFNTSHLTAGNTTIESIFVDNGSNGDDAFSTRIPDASIVTTPTTGADKSVFAAWTIADLTGKLTGF